MGSTDFPGIFSLTSWIYLGRSLDGWRSNGSVELHVKRYQYSFFAWWLVGRDVFFVFMGVGGCFKIDLTAGLFRFNLTLEFRDFRFSS